ncbi:PRC-barrel domain-containing protein [Streptomyces yangpuensis]|uniref:PRC-barrel domain-containing protein n=1 Tax=Streptomyces yangpuensis TaxID=1648182 RepID=UPI00381B1B63
MKRFGDVIRLPVVAADTAERVGKVTGVVLAPAPARVEFVHVHTVRGDELVAWAEVRAIGPDAVMINHVAGPFADASVSGRQSGPVGKSLLTDRGRRLGEVREVTFDEEDGRLVSLTTAADVLDGARLLGVGDFAVVITDQAIREADESGSGSASG